MSSHYLSIENVDKTFEKGNVRSHVLSNINLHIDQGEYISIIGHSGCGKSTVLNIVAGLIEQSAGVVILDRKEVNTPGPDRALVFQNHSLLPWLTVYENVALAVDKVAGRSKSTAERHEWVLYNLELVNMLHALNKRPSEISGGMKQRVGIARALAMQPKVLLLDEPFGALDALTRAHLQDEVMRIHSNLKNTVMMITHDVDEAVLLSDRIVMMTNGPSATIGEILHIDLPRPRDRIALTDDLRYNHYRQEVLRFLYEKQRKLEQISPRHPPSQAQNERPQPVGGSGSSPSDAVVDAPALQKVSGAS
ncbi:MAG: ABC transporter ATP-binding protein [Pseudohongiella sp.]|nr:ABC transporter ATP-binding protein [Pseudohongiella sp.]